MRPGPSGRVSFFAGGANALAVSPEMRKIVKPLTDRVLANFAEGSMANGLAVSGKENGFWPLALGSLGVVYGDIGTSPLYAFKESLASAHELSVTDATTLGIASLILWALLIIVTVKYVVVILRADNHGEGGTLTLM